MRPYARRSLESDQQRVFNYRLSRARRTIENAFGILVARWAILQNPIRLKLSTAEAIIQAITCLHNFILTMNMEQHDQEACHRYENVADERGPNGVVTDGDWRRANMGNGLENVGRIGANVGTVTAIKQRDTMAQYFISNEGAVPWQWDLI